MEEFALFLHVHSHADFYAELRPGIFKLLRLLYAMGVLDCIVICASQLLKCSAESIFPFLAAILKDNPRTMAAAVLTPLSCFNRLREPRRRPETTHRLPSTRLAS